MPSFGAIVRIHDISRPLQAETVPWPGDEPFCLRFTARRAEGSSVNLTAYGGSPHVGTHADAPLHIEDGLPAIDELDLAPYLGPARVVRARVAADGLIYPDGLPALDEGPRRLLVRTDTDPDPFRWPARFAAFSLAAAQAFVDAGLVLVGIDTPSVDEEHSKALPAHHALLAGGLRWLENLDLSRIEPGVYELIALPLPIRGADASPVRAVLIERAPA